MAKRPTRLAHKGRSMTRLIFLLTTASLLGFAVPAGAEPLGRLFFSPDERARLDQLRNGHASANAPTGQQSPIEQITLNGLVRSSSGKTTAWINKLPQHENETTQGVVVQQGQTSKPSAVLLLPSGKKVNLKAGQTLTPGNGVIREGYQSLPKSASAPDTPTSTATGSPNSPKK